MSTSLQNTINEQIRVLTEDEMRRVLNFVNALRKENTPSGIKPISVIFEELSSEIPFDEWSDLPSDGAENHDHYLYGAPKRTK